MTRTFNSIRLGSRLVVGLAMLSLPVISWSTDGDTVEIKPGHKVCGDVIEDDVAAAWKRFEAFDDGDAGTDMAAHDEQALHAHAKGFFKSESPAWPGPIRRIIGEQIRHLENASIPFQEFRIRKFTPPGGGIETGGRLKFSTTGDEIVLPVAPDSQDCQAHEDALKQVASFGYVMETIGFNLKDPARKAAAEEIAKKGALLDKYLFEGFPMFPWEAWVNSYFLTPEKVEDGPPRSQHVVLHPSAGVVGTVKPGEEHDTAAVLAIEPYGRVWYTEDYDHWYGVSLLALFPTDRDPGYGIALNYDEYKLGITYGTDEDYKGLTLFFGLELFSFAGEKLRKYDEYKKKYDQARD